ncbi:MAG: hypothetical protein GY869_01625, partial [Planctomycetes bacterium]|nr:hypothetical protein [Planctomycetota bacterium]
RTETPVVDISYLTAIRDLTGYNIYRSTESGFTPDPTNLVTTIDDPEILEFEDWGPDSLNLPPGLDVGLANGTTYYFLATALYGDEGESDPTAQEAEATPVNVTPADPTNLGSISIGRTITLFWDDNTEYDFMEYNIYRRTADTEYTVIATSNESAYEDNLENEPDGHYCYEVTAVDYYGAESGYSNEVGEPIGQIPVGPPVEVNSSEMGDYITVSWTHPTAGGCGGPDTELRYDDGVAT